MGLIVFAAIMAPRVALGLMWYFGDRVDKAFEGSFLPALGLIFLPFATIMYILLWSQRGGVEGAEWFLVGIAGAVDVVLTVTRLIPKRPYE
jgi:hypothetical protein